jgi:hypothetical protein
MVYAPTGGNRAHEEHLRQLQKNLRELADSHGFPKRANTKAKQGFDSDSGALLHESMNVCSADASHAGVWGFLCCVLAPGIVRWRFPGDKGKTSEDRFLGGVRNCFGRVWWRAHVLRDGTATDPYHFLKELGEDELVQIMERPGLGKTPPVARQSCVSFLRAIRRLPKKRMAIMRDAQKRLRRLLPMVAFETLDPEDLDQLVDRCFKQSLLALATEA